MEVPHVRGLAWLQDAPDVEQLLSSDEDADVISAAEEITNYVDGLISTMNTAIATDRSNEEWDAPKPKTNPHVCNRSYAEVADYQMDLIDLIATCQRHTRCSAAYCLKTKKGKQKCRFGFPNQAPAAGDTYRHSRRRGTHGGHGKERQPAECIQPRAAVGMEGQHGHAVHFNQTEGNQVRGQVCHQG